MEIKIAKYQDLLKIPVTDNKEIFCFVNKYDQSIKMKYTLPDMRKYFDGKIIVRQGVAEKLAKANAELQKANTGYTLLITYGYRSPKIQKEYFDNILKTEKNSSKLRDKLQLFEKVHKKIAVPEVAGHPTGGAIDITIYNNKTKTNLDMGGNIADFSGKHLSTFSDNLTQNQKQNRKLLLDLMLKENFCPFFEEWWHFSFGDKEWAFYYNKNHAIYDQVNINDIYKNLDKQGS